MAQALRQDRLPLCRQLPDYRHCTQPLYQHCDPTPQPALQVKTYQGCLQEMRLWNGRLPWVPCSLQKYSERVVLSRHLPTGISGMRRSDGKAGK